MPLLLATADFTQINPGLIFWTIVTFVVVLLILRATAWGPILELVETREKAITDAIDAAKRERSEAERLLAEQKSAIADARREAAEMMKRNKEEVDRFRDDLLAKSRKEAEELLAQARRQIEDEKQKALAQVKNLAVDLAIGAASKLLAANLDSVKQRELVAEYIDKLPSSRAA
jgi:F-type H+-transporting ATPase subunit b